MFIKIGNRTFNTNTVTNTTYTPAKGKIESRFLLFHSSPDERTSFIGTEADALNNFWNENVVTNIIPLPQPERNAP